MVQWGIPGTPAVAAKWKEDKILDDPVTQSNKRGTITFATSGKNSGCSGLTYGFCSSTPNAAGTQGPLCARYIYEHLQA